VKGQKEMGWVGDDVSKVKEEKDKKKEKEMGKCWKRELKSFFFFFNNIINRSGGLPASDP
jgi:hypothetical protein